jgi:glycosyltransferase involved in cell wall biosynthesis
LLNKADRIFCPSDIQRKEILEIVNGKCINGKIVLQSNCIQVDNYRDIVAKKDLLEKYNLSDEIKLLTVARILPRKGIKYLVLALNKLIKQYKFNNIKLMIIGPDCGELKNIKTLISKLSLESNIVIIGSVSYKQVKDFLGICDIFVLPSLYEGLPLALLEAMAAAKAVIFTDLLCSRYIIKDGENGLLVKPTDIDSLAKAILKLSDDKKLRQSLGFKAREKVQNFDSRFESQRVKKIYEHILRKEF